MLHVHRAERADRLADRLAETLLAPLEDPFEPDVVAVPTRGIERWLTQRLSTRLGTTGDRQDGVCANVEFPFPGRLIQGALAAASGIDPENDPWVAERSVWPLLEVVDECLGEPWLATLARHLEGARGDPEDPMRRFGAVRHIADLFDRYGVHRPDMVRAWARGPDGAPEAWQPELWRRLRARIGAPSPAERLAPACERIRNDPGLLDLPMRMSLFGLTRIPRSYLDVLAAIARRARRPSVRAPPVAGALGECRRGASRRPADREQARRPDRGRARQPAARVLGPRRPRAPAGGGERRREHRPPPRAGRGRTPHAARDDPARHPRGPPAARAPAPRRVRPQAPLGPGRPEPSRSTPATAGRARSRCSATWSSTCSRTTPRSSRAT